MPKGESDRYGSGGGCGCDPSAGAIVLFYAYVPLVDPAAVVSRLRLACERGGVTGKLRVAPEGINGTAAGPDAGVDALIRALATDPEPALAGAAKTLDYKREPGCAHLFPAGLSVRLVPEIVPFCRPVAVPNANPRGAPDDAPDDAPSTSASSAARVEHLDPRAFHREVLAAAATSNPSTSPSRSSPSAAPPLVLDVRNYYESRVGRFDGAVLAPIRRFSQLPEWCEAHPELFRGRRVLMYCTGGIRCEKAARWLAASETCAPASVAQLRGGVAAYARDVVHSETQTEKEKETEAEAGIGDRPHGQKNERPPGYSSASGFESATASCSRSAFRGANFVFDARGLVRVTDDVVGWCDGCGVAADRVGACASVGCHKILVVCESCEMKDAKVRCCAACAAQDSESEATGEETETGRRRRRRTPCDCDGYASRERRLRPRAE